MKAIKYYPPICDMVKNVDYVFCSAKNDRSTYDFGFSWYDRAHNYAYGLSQVYGVPYGYVSAVIAVLSPNISWDRNMLDTTKILRWYHDNEDDQKYSAYGANVNKAMGIMIDRSLSYVRGNKVKNFFKCIYNPHDNHSVVVDRHAVRVAVGGKLNGKDTSKFVVGRNRYDRIACAYRIVAKRHNLLPLQTQAITWAYVTNNGYLDGLFDN
jgi:hypothetical protein